MKVIITCDVSSAEAFDSDGNHRPVEALTSILEVLTKRIKRTSDLSNERIVGQDGKIICKMLVGTNER